MSVEYSSPNQLPRPSRMHVCEDHEEMLPEGIRPMLMPDRRQEADLLLFYLDSDLYPTVPVACVDCNEKKRGTSEVEMPQVFCTCEMNQQSIRALKEY